jgi:hypothetical protein
VVIVVAHGRCKICVRLGKASARVSRSLVSSPFILDQSLHFMFRRSPSLLVAITL